MTGEASNYAVGLVEDSLGLPRGWLKGDMMHAELLDAIESSLTGGEIGNSAEPFLDKMILEFGKDLQETYLDKYGFAIHKTRWPGGAQFAACLTHDVDNVSRPMAHLLARRKRFTTTDLVLAILHLRSVYNNISFIAKEEGERGLRSSFYFLAQNYPLSQVSAEVTKLRRDGWEVGLHGDFGTHDSPVRLAEVLEAFEKGLSFVPRGVREHFLQFEFESTWEILEGAQFDYDSTVGLRDKLGFKVGLAHPFHPPSREWKPLNLIELPLVLMDTTLWGYLGKDEQSGMDEYLSLKERVKMVGGLLTILWHQEAARMRGGRIYPAILDDLLRETSFISSGEVVSRWWRGREVPLLVDGNTIRLGGRPPEKLVLRFFSRDERALRVEGGSLERRGEATFIRADSEVFRTEVL